MSQGPVSLSILSVPSPVDRPRHQAPSGLEHGNFVECLDRMLELPALAVQPGTTVHVLEALAVWHTRHPLPLLDKWEGETKATKGGRPMVLESWTQCRLLPQGSDTRKPVGVLGLR